VLAVVGRVRERPARPALERDVRRAGHALHRRGADQLGVGVSRRRVDRRRQREVGIFRRHALCELLVRALAEVMEVSVAGLDVAEVVVLADRHEALARERGQPFQHRVRREDVLVRRHVVLEEPEGDVHVCADEIDRAAHGHRRVRAVLRDELQREVRHAATRVARARRCRDHRAHASMEREKRVLEAGDDLVLFADADERVALDARQAKVSLELA